MGSLPGRVKGRKGVGRAPLFAVAGLLVAASAALGQVPPDSMRADTIRPALRKDTVPGKDTVPAAAKLTTLADTAFYNLPSLAGSRAVGWGPGVWTWDHDAIMASGANNLAELVAAVPGVVTLQGGDYGTPLAVSAFGVAAGRVRVIRDGVEVVPLEGGVTNLATVGLAGIQEVRLERQPGELVIRMQSIRYADARPYSLVEAGTGDFNTNLLRATFADPRALGGSVALALERVDTRGPGGAEPGSIGGSWLRYELHHGDAAGLALDYRSTKSTTQVTDYPASTTRTDWSVRGSARLLKGLTGEAYWGHSTHRVDDPRTAYLTEGGTVRQVGAGASWQHQGLFARADWRSFGGSGLPKTRLDLMAGGGALRLGGFSAELHREGWPGTTTMAKQAQAWSNPVAGVLTLFGSWESGSYGGRTGPLEDVVPADSALAAQVAAADTLPPGPLFHVSHRTAIRAGAQLSWRGTTLSAAFLSLKADSLLPLGLEMDRGTPPLPGGRRTGWEAVATLPVPVLGGLDIQGSYQQWDAAWSYLPKRIYDGAVVYHNTFLPTGDLELWTTVGVRGHDPMDVRVVTGTGGLATVPFYQSWYFHLQVRVVTVRAFIDWENFSIRTDLQDFPGRVLPMTRATYGVRWNLWN
jgi:hypothetical protein